MSEKVKLIEGTEPRKKRHQITKKGKGFPEQERPEISTNIGIDTFEVRKIEDKQIKRSTF